MLCEVGPDEVFNLPLYEHHLVIDIRPSQKYSQGHMATAVSFPSPALELVASHTLILVHVTPYLSPLPPSRSRTDLCRPTKIWLSAPKEKFALLNISSYTMSVFVYHAPPFSARARRWSFLLLAPGFLLLLRFNSRFSLLERFDFPSLFLPSSLLAPLPVCSLLLSRNKRCDVS